MNRREPCLLLALVLLALAGAAHAGQRKDSLEPLRKSGEVITAPWHAGSLTVDPEGAEWQDLEPAEVTLYPQATVQPRSAAPGPVPLLVRALYNRSDLALHLEWSDDHPAARHDIGQFPDAVAVQWPVRYGRGIRLPYVGMGHPGFPVAVWFWRADGRVETLAAEGFGSLTRQPPDGVEAKAVWREGKWRIVLKRSLQVTSPGAHIQMQPTAAGLVPIGLAVWNGEAHQRDGDKFLSAWHFLHFEHGKVDPRYVNGLLWSPRIKGDPEAGKALMRERGCGACHSYPGNPILTEVGPGLTWAGGIHRPDYLLESIKSPSTVIVPGKIFSTVTEGKRVSAMPALKTPERELFHMVEYLRRLRRLGKGVQAR